MLIRKFSLYQNTDTILEYSRKKMILAGELICENDFYFGMMETLLIANMSCTRDLNSVQWNIENWEEGYGEFESGIDFTGSSTRVWSQCHKHKFVHNSPFSFQNSLIDHNLLVYCDVFRDADYITQYQGGLHPNWSDFSIYSQRRTLLTKPKTKKMCLRVFWFSRFKSVVEQAILNVRGAAKNYLYA